jgi:site-specific recombinase XerC
MEKKRITVLPHQFNNNDYYLLKFNFDETLVSIARSLGCRWLVSEQGWSIYRSRENLKALIRAFSEISIFDTSKIGITDAEVSYGEKISTVPEAYSQVLIRKGYNDKTIQVYKSLFREFMHHFKDKNLKEIQQEDLVTYMEGQVKGKKISVHSEKQLIEAINLYFTGVLKRKELEFSVSEREKPGQAQKKVSQKELNRMLEVTGNVKHKAVLSLLYASDLKRDQITTLQKDDVDLKKMTISTSNGEEAKPVKRKLEKSSKIILDKYLEVYQPEKWLFEGFKGNPYSKSSIISVIRRASFKAGLDKKVPKSKRNPENETHSGS